MALLSSGPLFSPTSLNSLLVALMGWMPSTIDVSVWHSFWCFERRKQVHYKPGMKEAFFDFYLGWGTAVMALLFLSLGALVVYGTGESFSSSAVFPVKLTERNQERNLFLLFFSRLV